MSEETPLTPEEFARQARQHLDSLRAAGVEWLPAAPPPATPPARPKLAAAARAAEVPAPEPVFTPTLPGLLGGETPQGLSLDRRRQELQLLAEQVSHCTRCAELAATRRRTVFGVGQVDTDLCFIGEAPGADEDRQGEPFVGAAGQLLNRIIVAMGMKREEVFICNILRCRPPGNRQPLPDEAANCREWLDKTLGLVRPKHLCCLGATAAQNLLGTTLGIGRLRGRFHDYQGIPVLCTYHPAALLRDPSRKRDVWEDMKKLLAKMGRPVPGA
jgi:DNA polymerase